MDKPKNKYITLTYKLYTVGDDGERELVEEATAERPFLFISGFGIALEAFEKQTADLERGATFAFDLTKDEAYGDYDPAHVVVLEREVFCINGHFDHEHIFKDAIVPLQNEDGNKFYGRVIDMNDEKVKMDLNHPLAGKKLHFEGMVLESRDATNNEIENMVNRLSGECECGCEHEHCECGHSHEGQDQCCGGHHHEDGHCCGGHHHEGGHCCHHHEH